VLFVDKIETAVRRRYLERRHAFVKAPGDLSMNRENPGHGLDRKNSRSRQHDQMCCIDLKQPRQNRDLILLDA
jgi:hypothetical protein